MHLGRSQFNVQEEFNLLGEKIALAKTRRILRLRSQRAPGADPRYIRQNITFKVPAGLCRAPEVGPFGDS